MSNPWRKTHKLKSMTEQWTDKGASFTVYLSERYRWRAQLQRKADCTGEMVQRNMSLSEKGLNANVIDSAAFAQAFIRVLAKKVSDFDVEHMIAVFSDYAATKNIPDMPKHALPDDETRALKWYQGREFVLPRNACSRWVVMLEVSNAPLGAGLARMESLGDQGISCDEVDSRAFAISWLRGLAEELTPRNITDLIYALKAS